MRYLGFLLCLSLVFASCTDDLPILDNKLQLDGPNNTSPILNAGIYEAAVYFSPSIMENKADRQLREIDFYLFNAPPTLEVIVYGEGSVIRPGTELYSADLSSNLRENNWNTHVLSQPLTLDGNPIWISVKFTSDEAEQIIGCDAGPKVNGGDQLNNNGDWTTFESLSGENINWNVRGDLVPQ